MPSKWAKIYSAGRQKQEGTEQEKHTTLIFMTFIFIKCYKQLLKIPTFRVVFKTVRTYTNHSILT